MLRDGSYITIQSWMRTKLELKGNDLLVYAIIYGFSQTENQRFTGSLQYLADWCGATKQGILKNIKNLMARGLIAKYENEALNLVEYYATQFNTPLNSVEYPIKLSLTNNIDNKLEEKLDNTITINSNSTTSHNNFEFGKKKETKPKKKNLYDTCVGLIDEFTDDAILRELLIHSLQLFLENSKESGNPMYTNYFKGKLNVLKKLSDDNYQQRKIVKQTLDNGWNNFYALKSSTGNKFSESSSIRSSAYYDEDYIEENNRKMTEREKNGQRTKF